MRTALLSALLGTALALPGEFSRADIVASGQTVESVQAHYAGDRAGVRSGDILTGWSYSHSDNSDEGDESDGSPLATYFDLAELEDEVHPQRPVTLRALRDDATISFALGAGAWRIRTKPVWDDDTDRRYREILKQLEAEDSQPGIDAAVAFARELRERDGAIYAAWLLSNVAESVYSLGQLRQTSELFAQAISELDRQGNPQVAANLQHRMGLTLIYQRRFDEATSAYSTALELQEGISPTRMGVAANTVRLGSVAVFRGDFDSARQYMEEGLWLFEKLAPESMQVAGTLSELGRMAGTKGDLVEAGQFYRRSLGILDAQNPDGVEVAQHLSNLGVSVRLQGDQAGAEALYLRAHALLSVLDPESRSMSAVLNNIGGIKEDRGDLSAADHYFRQALALSEKLNPDSDSVALYLDNLGVVAAKRGDLSAAHDYHLRSLQLTSSAAPDSMAAAISYSHLGHVTRQLKDYDAAETHFRDAMRITKRHAPTSQVHARVVLGLGEVAEHRGNEALARKEFEIALSVFAEVAPKGRGVAETALKLGDMAVSQNELAGAERLYERASTIIAVIAPDTYLEAMAHYGFARIHRMRQETGLGRASFERAIQALDAQHPRLGGTEESKSSSRAKYRAIYTDYIDFLLDIGDREAAFDVLERSRAKILSELLQERELVFSVDLPEDLERERRSVAHVREELQAALLNSESRDSAEKLQLELHAVRQRQVSIQQKIRESAPRLADLQAPLPVSLASVRKTLRPGTAVLSYAVGKRETQLFLLTSGGELAVQTLPVGRSELNDRVTRFRHLIDAGRWDEQPDEALLSVAADLYKELIEPVEPALENAERLLIVPDAALQILPFAALVKSYTDDMPRYLVQWKPSLVVNSLTVYGQLRNHSIQTEKEGLIAFGDPAFSSAVVATNDAYIVERGLVADRSLMALPWSRAEVEDIGDIYKDNAHIYTGADATEERAKAIQRDTRYLHFASHALLNERHPMETSIVLATPNQSSPSRENGFLQAWEVFESLRLNADLVTLSACETALGTEYPGEGLMGLTRAFQYAGASSVLASLWNVNDRSTSMFMTQFYADLNAGMSTEVALQRVQTMMSKGTTPGNDKSRSWLASVRGWFGGNQAGDNYTHPYHWAGFVLSGSGG